jgi:arginyl-tRNA synthetase
MTPLATIADRLAAALRALDLSPVDLRGQIRPTQDSKFGDYQANVAMTLAKERGVPPRQLATSLVEHLDLADLCDAPQIAGPGFINFRLHDRYLAQCLSAMLLDPQLTIERAAEPRTVVVDYSSPNVAKPLHVGHLRTTVIGEALVRMLRFAGHRVITDNHLGDWGTQFGMVIYGYKHLRDHAAYTQDPVAELGRLYQRVNQLVEYHEAVAALPAAEQRAEQAATATAQATDPKAVKDAQRRQRAADEEVARLRSQIDRVSKDPQAHAAAVAHPEIRAAVLDETVKLHHGDAENRRLWKEFMPYCLAAIQRIYDRLGVEFDYVLGESFYDPYLAHVIKRLEDNRLLSTSQGASVVFLDGFETPMIVRKQDGAYLYATTDLATLEYRRREFAPDEILYVVDHRQGEHFEKLFAVARLWGDADLTLRHISYGTVMGEDRRPFKTRSGGLVGLESLLDDAVARAEEVVCNPERLERLEEPLTEEQQQNIAKIVGIGAIKYADLSHHRTSDYIFSLEKMVSLDGNTAAYVQYSYARMQGILRRAGVTEEQLCKRTTNWQLTNSAERELAIQLIRFPEVFQAALQDYLPNLLVDYLYELSRRYAVFFEQCPVLSASDEGLRDSRLGLCAITGRVLRTGLSLLGIGVVPRM